jgi:hypothetical protein
MSLPAQRSQARGLARAWEGLPAVAGVPAHVAHAAGLLPHASRRECRPPGLPLFSGRLPMRTAAAAAAPAPARHGDTAHYLRAPSTWSTPALQPASPPVLPPRPPRSAFVHAASALSLPPRRRIAGRRTRAGAALAGPAPRKASLIQSPRAGPRVPHPKRCRKAAPPPPPGAAPCPPTRCW